jgi:glycosyltransferase involved in cell wall biosynthesis
MGHSSISTVVQKPEMSIRVLRILNRFNVGGPTYNGAYLTKYLPSEFETMLVAGNIEKHEGSSTYILEDLDLRYRIIPNMYRPIHPLNDFIALKHIISIINEFKPDIVHTHAAKAGALGRLASILASHHVPVVVHTYHGNVFEGYFSPTKERIFLEIERQLAKKTNAIIGISNSQKKDLVEKYKIANEEKVCVVPLGFDLKRMSENVDEKRLKFRNEFELDDDVVVVTIIGRLTSIKNQKLFISVFRKTLEATSHKLKAFIVGDGEDRQSLVSYCESLGLSWSSPQKKNPNSKVHFTSWRKDIDIINAGSDIILLTSRNEGTPVSIIEAMATGRAVICTDVGGVSDIINNRVSGLIVSNSETEISTALTELVENIDFRLSLGRKAQPEVLNKFGYQRLVNDIAALYRLLISK